MNIRSESIDQIIPALVAARAHFPPIRKSKRANYGDYADTHDIISAIEPILSQNGLYLRSGITFNEHGLEILFAEVSHISGQWLSSSCYMKPNMEKDAMWGGCITFRTRYLYKNLLGLSIPDDLDDDDDGHAVITQAEYEFLASLPVGFQNQIKERNGIDDLRLLPRSQFAAIKNYVDKKKQQG